MTKIISERQRKHLEKIALLRKERGYWQSNEAIERRKNNGKPWHSNKTIEKIRKKAIGRKQTPEQIEYRIGKIRGRKQTDIEKLHHSLALRGKKKSLEHRLKISGKNHYNWKGGVTSLLEKIRGCTKYYEWRYTIYQRDKFTCCNCHKVGGRLEAHHIKEFSKIIAENNITTFEQALKCKELWDIDNGVTLCEDCHNLIHFSSK